MNFEMYKYAFIDSHIHLDLYNEVQRDQLFKDLHSNNAIQGLVAVSMDQNSSAKNLQYARQSAKIYPAFGFHPEQPLPTAQECTSLFDFMNVHLGEMIAVGEVGLPYYSRLENPSIPHEPYIQLLEKFIVFAKEHDKPIILHAVYEDARIACDLLEKHNIKKAHFHWWKGDKTTRQRIANNGYYISVTPDILYELEIQDIIQNFPLEQLLVETDGPWTFEHTFSGKMTHPLMITQSIQKIGELVNLSEKQVASQLLSNTKNFYSI